MDKIIKVVSAPPEAKLFSAIQQAPGCERKLEAPQSSWDGMLMTTPAGTTATPTNVTDPEFGFEIAEVFAMALLRDKPFATWADDAEVQKVIGLLNTYPNKSSAPLDEGGKITANTLMRGAGADETIGPYVSQVRHVVLCSFTCLPAHLLTYLLACSLTSLLTHSTFCNRSTTAT